MIRQFDLTQFFIEYLYEATLPLAAYNVIPTIYASNEMIELTIATGEQKLVAILLLEGSGKIRM